VVAKRSFASSGSLAPALVETTTAAAVQSGLAVLPAGLGRLARRGAPLPGLGKR
jgi:hypothetical protein